MKKEFYIGVMSGTSLDGVDVALCSITKNSCVLVKSYEHKFPKKLKREILYAITNPVTLQTMGELHIKLGKLFAKAVNNLIKKYALERKKIKAIGLHGQTLWHHPHGKHPFSLQLGSPAVVAAKTNMDVVADFRSGDIANGGEGAPFAPAFHAFAFKHNKHAAIVNIGGMANITLLHPNTQGWDVGAGNVLLDYWAHKHLHAKYDKNGKFAGSGKIDTKLLKCLLADPYIKKQTPKSTGREYFNPQWLNKKIKNFTHLKACDVQATLTEFCAQTIADAIKGKGVNEIILCGGGAKNSYLRKRIEKCSACYVTTSDKYGIESDFLEAMAFAYFAYKRLKKEKIKLKTVTGAKHNTLLGAIYPA